MKTTIDAAGRLMIPEEIRRQAGLVPGVTVEIRFQNGQVEIEPVPLAVKLVRKGRLLVAAPDTDVAPLTSDLVQATMDAFARCQDPPLRASKGLPGSWSPHKARPFGPALRRGR